MSSQELADPSSVNFHLWEPCNMRCRFCFATFQDVKNEMNLPKGHLPKADCLSLVKHLAEFGYKKINFAGGEPMLCPWLDDLILLAKQYKMVTSIVTNGSKITAKWLNSISSHLDWIAISIDSVDPEKLKCSGRIINGNQQPLTEEEYLQIIREIKRHHIRLKINTVVHSGNWQEDFSCFIKTAMPERWKVLQALPVKGQNDKHINDWLITPEQFESYVLLNGVVQKDGITVVLEDNELMTKSYVMIDPAGRFFDNESGSYNYSDPILEVGVKEALSKVSIDPQRFRRRGGQYNW